MSEILTGNIVLSDQVVFGRLVIEGEKIAGIETLGPERAGEDVIVPGFLDIHFHGTGPHSIVTYEDLEGIAAFEPANGVTAFTPALASCDRQMRVDYLRNIRKLSAGRSAGCAVRLHINELDCRVFCCCIHSLNSAIDANGRYHAVSCQ